MQKAILLIVFLTSTSLLFAQNIEKLDAANGFKNFKLSSSKKNYYSYMRDTSKSFIQLENISYPDLQSAFGIDLRRISVQFDTKNKLAEIFLEFPYAYTPSNSRNKSESQYEVYNSIVKAFGEPTKFSQNGQMEFFGETYEWTGKKVILQLKMDFFSGNGEYADRKGWQVQLYYYPRSDYSKKKSASTDY